MPCRLVSSVCLAVASLFLALSAISAPKDSAVAEDDHLVVGGFSGTHVLPTKQILEKLGETASFGGRPVDLVVSPDGRTIYVKNLNNLVVVETAKMQVLQATNYPGHGASMRGIALSADARHVYVTGSDNELYVWTASATGKVSFDRAIKLPRDSYPCGLALTPDGMTAYVCLGSSNTLAVVSLTNDTVIRQIPVGVSPMDVALSPNGLAAYVSNWGGRHPVAGERVGRADGTGVVMLVDERGIASSGTISFVDLVANRETLELPTDLHPNGIKLTRDGGTLYVANANSDTVTIINTLARTVRETVLVRPDPTLPFGSAPSSLDLSRDETRLYVTAAGNNALAVVELPNAQHTNSVLSGFIPAGAYPAAVAAGDSSLYVVNTKGWGTSHNTVYNHVGTVGKIPLPSPDQLVRYTAQANKNGRIPQILQTRTPARADVKPVPVPAHVGEPSVFQHILFIIKENKTYDAVLGDLPQGNGDPTLCMFNKKITPNHHALAKEYVLLDNYYCNGVYSTDGRTWCSEGIVTDFWEKSFGGQRASHPGIDPLMYSSSGFIWGNVLQHGLTFRNHGFMGFAGMNPHGTWLEIYRDYTSHAGRFQGYETPTTPPVLPAYSSTNASGWNLSIPDQIRADNFLREFNLAQASNSWPVFNILYLPDDHTAGDSPNFPTARAQVADNDLALGRVVEAVTKSLFASNTVIFVIEDDPQLGMDHVDGHRSLCLVVSPYAKRRKTVSTFYNQAGVLHTMEQIMGLPPMNQMDAMSPLMTDCFVNQPDLTPYKALTNNIPLDEMNPGSHAALSPKDRYWAGESMKMDFSKPDLINDDLFNRIIWHSLKGDARYPSEYAGPHGRGLRQLGLASYQTRDDDD